MHSLRYVAMYTCCTSTSYFYSETKQRDRRSQPDPLHSLVLHDAVGQTGLASSKSGLELVEPESVTVGSGRHSGHGSVVAVHRFGKRMWLAPRLVPRSQGCALGLDLGYEFMT